MNAVVILSSAATVIASQALISGAFSPSRQATLLGYMPRMTINTRPNRPRPIYVPEINWFVAIACIVLVVTFPAESDRLAAAYDGTMTVTSSIFYVVIRQTWGWSRTIAIRLVVLFLVFDLPFFVSNLFKFVDG